MSLSERALISCVALESVEESFRDLYQDDGTGKHVLKVEGAVPKQQVDDFRANNLALKTALEKFEGIDPDKTPEILDAWRGVSDGKFVENAKKEDVDKMVERRTEEMTKKYETEINKAQDFAVTMKRELETVKVNQALLTAGATAGLRKGAEADLLSRGREVFSLDDQGNLVARDDKGEVRYGAAGQPLSPAEFIKELATQAEHLFSENVGGGAGGSGTADGSTAGTNPFKKETHNMTEQAKMIKTDPKEAKRLAAQAGVTIKIPNA